MLITLIKKIFPRIDINSDEWRAYSKRNQNGYNHFTINQNENFVNPEIGKHNKLVECL